MKINVCCIIVLVFLFCSSLSVWALDQEIIWKDLQLKSNNNAVIFNDVIWDGEQYIAVGNSGWIATSKTGVDWDYKKLVSDDVNLTMVSSQKEYILVIGVKEEKEKQYSRFIYKKDKYGELSFSSSGMEGNLHYDLKSIASDNIHNFICVGGKFIQYKPSGLIQKASIRSLFREIDNDNNINTPALSTYLNSVTWGNNIFLAVGMNMKIISSSNGDTWYEANIDSMPLAYLRNNNVNLNYVIWNGTQFIAVGNQATILTSKDGFSWSIVKNNLGKEVCIQSVAATGNQYIITGENGFCARSKDLKNWQKVSTEISADFQKIVSSGSNIVAITNKASLLVGLIKMNTKPISSGVLVNGKNVNFEAYGVGGNTYFKLRDIAAILNGTLKQFDVSLDKASNSISLAISKPYQKVGGELTSSGKTEVGTTVITETTLMIDGRKVKLSAFSIGGNNYFKLRDLGKLLDFGVLWDSKSNRIEMNTSISYMSP